MASVRVMPQADVAVAVVLATYAVAEGLVIDAPAGWMVGAPLATLTLAWRRRFPIMVVGTLLALIVLPGPSDTVLPLPLIIISAYTAGRESGSGRTTLIGAGAIGLVLGAHTLIAAGSQTSGAADLVAVLVLVGGAAGAGHLMRARQAENRELQTLTTRLAAERDLHAQAAVAAERARVARELHDIVAHSISLIAVQAGAAQALMGRDDARAQRSLESVQETARAALVEMRRLLTVLRTDEAQAVGLAPQPGLTAVSELVEQVRGGGLPVALREEGARPAVPAGIDLSAFRIVQEALTNVRRHAGTVPTEVLVRYAPGEVVVEVSNAEDPGGPAAGSGDSGGRGYGVAGMRERARIYGGTLEVERRDGRYVVHARLPLNGVPE